jgi:hypothetical protein
MLNAGILTFREFVMGERLPLAEMHHAVLEFLQGRDDAVVFGAQAVNAYVSEPRMTQDIDLLSMRAAALAEELRKHLSDKFRVAVRLRDLGEGRGFRVHQVQKSGNRHLVEVRSVASMPSARRIENILVIAPADLVASKVFAYCKRRGRPKAGTDWRDVAMLLLAFPDLKTQEGEVLDKLTAAGAGPEVLATWRELVAQDIRPEPEADEP